MLEIFNESFCYVYENFTSGTFLKTSGKILKSFKEILGMFTGIVFERMAKFWNKFRNDNRITGKFSGNFNGYYLERFKDILWNITDFLGNIFEEVSQN